jgi:hypothetical protein
LQGSAAVKILLGDTRSKRNIAFLREHGWGRMFATARPTPESFESWGFDNGAFTAWTCGRQFPEKAFLRRLEIALKVESDPIVAVCPDIVAGGMKSLEFSVHWIQRLSAHWPWYLAVQDGMTHKVVLDAIHMFSGIFLGGTDKFKLTAYGWSRLAHFADKKFHYGRAGTLRKIRHAWAVEADSLDSNFPLWSVERLETFRDEWNALKRGEIQALPFVDSIEIEEKYCEIAAKRLAQKVLNFT